MPAPKTASRYGTEYFRLVNVARHKFGSGEGFFELPVKSQKIAEKMRFRFYAFRRALENDIARHSDLEVRKERREQFKIADIMRLRVYETSNGWVLRVENAASEGTQEAEPLSDALDALEAEIFQAEHKDDVDVQAEIDHEGKVLDKLGVEKVDNASDLFDLE